MAERNLSIRLSVIDGGKVKAELTEIGEKGERSLKKIEAAATPASSGLKLLSSAANDAKFQLQAATDRLGLLGSVLGKLGPAGLIAGASIAALGVGITALVMPVARIGDEFFKLSQKTGVSVEALTALKYAADLSDLSTEGLTKALQKLSVAMFNTQIQGEEGSAALRALGVSAVDATGQIRPTEQVLLDLADKFSAMPDGADKAALAVKLFGKEGLAIIPLLNQGREGITALMDEARRLGLVMSEDVARASEALNDNLTRLSSALQGVQRQIGAAVIPILADLTEQVILAQSETGSFGNELQRISSNREAILSFLESVASGLAFVAESAVLAKRVIAQPFDSLSVVGNDIETWFKTDLLRTMKSMGYDPKVIDAEIAKLQAARDDYVSQANDRLLNINQNPGYADRVVKFFDEQRRTVRVMGQRFVLDTEAQAREVQAIYDKFLPTLPRKPRPDLDLSGFAKPTPAEKVNEGEAFLNQLRARLTRTQEGEAAELRQRALQIEAKGYQGVVAQAEQYIQVLEAIERQKEKDKAFAAYEKEEAAARKLVDNLIGANRQRIESAELQRQMLDLTADERVLMQTRVDLEKAAAGARKEAAQIEDSGLRAQAIEAINDALARQSPILQDLVGATLAYQRSAEYGAKSALRTYIDEATNAAKLTERVITGSLKSMESALAQFVLTGKFDFKSLADSIIADLVRIQIQRSITLPMANAMNGAMAGMDWGAMWGSLFPSAQGNVFEGAALPAYRNTVVDRPTVFPFAQGAGFGRSARLGLMGEKVGSPGEAIMPLTRMRDGDLGVRVQGGGSTVIVNVIESPGKGGQQAQRTDSQGNQVIDVWVEQIAAQMWGDVARGAGPGPGVLANTYGLNRVAGAY
ncbi:MAG: phage tail tape measure C-terminal domain-containing protein [Limnohabitans sp.]